jgi:hypothetical protein
MIQYSEASAMETRGRGVLDTRFRGYDEDPSTLPRECGRIGPKLPPTGMFVACFLGEPEGASVHDQNHPPS